MVAIVIIGALAFIGVMTVVYFICRIPLHIEYRRWEKEEQKKWEQQDPLHQFEKIEWEDPQIGSQVDIEAYTTFREYGLKLDRQKLYEMYKSCEEKKKNEQEAVDVEPVRHAHWIMHDKTLAVSFGESAVVGHYFECSSCGRIEDHKEPYCNCGAKMDEEEK